MKINIPIYIEGVLTGQYKGSKEDQLLTKNKLSQYTKANKYSITLYKDLHIDKASITSQSQFNEVINSGKWWKINHTAEAAIEFLQPFFEQYSFLRHKPLEIYVEQPSIIFIDKKNQRNDTFGNLKGRVVAKLIEPPKEIIKPKIIDPRVHGETVPPIGPAKPIPPPLPLKKGCFNQNDNWNSIFGLSDGPSGTGGLHGLTGGPLGSKGCFGKYGNPTGCFGGASMGGCFPNLNLGCLLPLLLLFLLLFSLLKSCSSIKTLDPVVNTIKKDRDDSRTPPPSWVKNPEDTSAPEPDYTPLVVDTTLKPDSAAITVDSTQLNSDSLKKVTDSIPIVKDTIPDVLGKGQFQLEVWDWDVEDKDTVSLFLNNKPLIENLRLRKKPYKIKEKGLKYGENYLEIRAMNIQKGSNTAAVRGFSDRSQLCDTTLIQKSTESSRLTLIYQ